MHMDRAIFDLKASTEATSLYILICSLLDQGATPTLEQVRSKWNGDDEKLFNAADELIRYGVLDGVVPKADKGVFRINPYHMWRWS